jgi:hypothetical protein
MTVYSPSRKTICLYHGVIHDTWFIPYVPFVFAHSQGYCMPYCRLVTRLLGMKTIFLLWHVDLLLCNWPINTHSRQQEMCFPYGSRKSIARQRLSKHVHAEVYRGTVGRQFLDSWSINTPTNRWETMFSVGSAPRLYNAEFRVSMES